MLRNLHAIKSVCETIGFAELENSLAEVLVEQASNPSDTAQGKVEDVLKFLSQCPTAVSQQQW